MILVIISHPIVLDEFQIFHWFYNLSFGLFDHVKMREDPTSLFLKWLSCLKLFPHLHLLDF